MTDNALLLMLGAFVTSSGLASIVAAIAIYFAWRSTKAQIVESRTQADKNERRQRWWEAVQWFDANRKRLGEPAWRDGMWHLSHKDLVETEAQRAILKAITNAPRP